MVHVSLVSVEVNTTWTFIAPHGDSKRSTSESRTSKSSTGSTMIDASSVTYRLSHDAQTDLLPLPSLLATSNPPIRAFPIVQTLAPHLTNDTYDHCAALPSSECLRLRTSPRLPCCMFTSCTLHDHQTPLSHYRTRTRCKTCAKIITNSPCSLAPDGSGRTRFFPSILER